MMLNITLFSLVSEISNISSTSTLLELSQDKKTKPTTASELFKNSDKRHSKDEDFFDSLGSSSGQLERPASELCLAQYQDGAVKSDALQHSSSQNDLVTLENQQQHNNTHLHSQMYPAHLMQNTESMQSITLSRDSLSAEPQNISIDLSAQNNAPLSETVDPLAAINQNQQQQFNQQAQLSQPQNQISSQQHQGLPQPQQHQQPPQQQQQQQQQPQYQESQQPQHQQSQQPQHQQQVQQHQPQQQQVEFDIDHMKSFDNPALAVEEESLGTIPLQNQVFPEQPATVQNTLLSQTQVSSFICVFIILKFFKIQLPLYCLLW